MTDDHKQTYNKLKEYFKSIELPKELAYNNSNKILDVKMYIDALL